MTVVLDASGDGRSDAVVEAAQAVRDGGIAVLPTDTLYGIGADAFSPEATRRIFEAKRRSRRFPLPVLVHTPKQLPGLCTTVPEAANRLMAAYWPGALTIVVAAEPHLAWDIGDADGTVAVRMPFDEVALELIRAVGPMAVTSANLSGQPPAPTVAAAREQFGDAVDVYLDAGARRANRPSTIVDLTRAEPHILREGALPGDEVLRVARGGDEPATDPGAEPDEGGKEPGATGA